jgi:hypothetical protein
MNIDTRIKQLEGERDKLVASHDATMAQFQQVLLNNRNRFQQLSGAIDVLKELQKPKGDNNDDSIPTSDLSDRTSDVRFSEQPQGR